MPSQNIAITRIDPHPDNARQDLGDLTELAASIKAVGLLHPLVVCAHPWRPGAFMLLDGHRRHGACKLLKLAQVPATIRPVPEDEQVIMLIADLHHSPLTAVERAEAMKKLQANGWPPAKIAVKTGLHISTISRILALNDLDEGTRDRVRAGIIPVGAAVAAVRQTRAGNRAAQGLPPRKVSVAAEHFSADHPLAKDAQIRCELGGHSGKKIGRSRDGLIACGKCWEDAIRADEHRSPAPAAGLARASR